VETTGKHEESVSWVHFRKDGFALIARPVGRIVQVRAGDEPGRPIRGCDLGSGSEDSKCSIATGGVLFGGDLGKLGVVQDVIAMKALRSSAGPNGEDGCRVQLWRGLIMFLLVTNPGG